MHFYLNAFVLRYNTNIHWNYCRFEYYLSKFQLFTFITLVTSHCPQIIVFAALQHASTNNTDNSIPVLCVIMQVIVRIKDRVCTGFPVSNKLEEFRCNQGNIAPFQHSQVWALLSLLLHEKYGAK